jgi:hypothetical protein
VSPPVWQVAGGKARDGDWDSGGRYAIGSALAVPVGADALDYALSRSCKEGVEMGSSPEPRLLPASRAKGCAFCEQAAQSQWVGGDELDEVIVPCCSKHVDQARERWEELYARFNDEVES